MCPVVLNILGAHHLVSAANAKKDLIRFDGVFYGLTLQRYEVLSENILFRILSAAEKNQIISIRIEVFTDRHRFNSAVDSAQNGASKKRLQIPPIAVQIQKIGVEMTNPKLFSHALTPTYFQNGFMPYLLTRISRSASIAV